MSSFGRICLLALVCILALGANAQAQALRVTPTSLEIIAPGATATVTLRNVGNQPATVQSRIFSWSAGGEDEALAQTRDVVISPPITTLAPGAVQTLRVVRTSKSPIRAEESYRLFVDELPTAGSGNGVKFVARLRIPVFFTLSNATPKALQWRLRSSGGRTYLEAQNPGGTHVRIVDLSVSSGQRRYLSQPGLAGYVLGQSTATWSLPAGTPSGVSVSAKSNFGTINSTAR